MGNPSELEVHLYITHICGSDELMLGEKLKASGHLALFPCLSHASVHLICTDFCTAPMASFPVLTHTHTHTPL